MLGTAKEETLPLTYHDAEIGVVRMYLSLYNWPKMYEFYYSFLKLIMLSYVLVSWSVGEMTLKPKEKKWSTDFFIIHWISSWKDNARDE